MTQTTKRLTPERERVIRQYVAQNHETDQERDLLSEIDALRSEITEYQSLHKDALCLQDFGNLQAENQNMHEIIVAAAQMLTSTSAEEKVQLENALRKRMVAFIYPESVPPR